MTVRVLIERELVPGNEMKIRQLLTQLRGKALNAKGYISGETLHSVDDPNKFLVISTWNTLENWKAWEHSAERKEIETKVDQILRSPAKSTVYTQE